MAKSDRSQGPAGPSAATPFATAREDSAAAIRALATLLEPDREGLRPVTREGVDAIKKSVLEHGLLRQFPILRDQHGRILGGRHRKAAGAELQAEGKLDRDWPEEVVRVADDREAIAIAMAANRARPWTPHDFQRLEGLGLEWAGTRGKRRMIRLALLENARRSNRAIARLVGCDDKTVGGVRAELEATAEIPQFVAKGGTDSRGQGITEGEPATPTPNNRDIDEALVEKLMDQGLGQRAIQKELGLSPKNGLSRVRTIMKRIRSCREEEAKSAEPDAKPIQREPEPDPTLAQPGLESKPEAKPEPDVAPATESPIASAASTVVSSSTPSPGAPAEPAPDVTAEAEEEDERAWEEAQTVQAFCEDMVCIAHAIERMGVKRDVFALRATEDKIKDLYEMAHKIEELANFLQDTLSAER